MTNKSEQEVAFCPDRSSAHQCNHSRPQRRNDDRAGSRLGAAAGLPNIEVIVVDDASIDQTVCRIENFAGLPVRLIHARRQLGASGARNVGIESACGTYIAFLDADDEWLSGKLTRQVDLLSRHPAMTFVTCEADLIGPGGNLMGRVNPGRERAIGVNAWKILLAYACVATPCVVARRDAVQAIGGFNQKLPIAEDQDL